jgi:purine-binding chemotaxis protein CheW
MGEIEQLALFRLDDQRYALPLAVVERVVRAAELTPLPKAPEIVLGVVDVNGTVLPVLNVRRRFHLADREIRTNDHFLIARTRRRRVVLVIDKAEGVIEVPAVEIVCAPQITAGIEQVSGVMKLADGLVLIHDIDSFLSLEEEEILDEVMSEEISGT